MATRRNRGTGGSGAAPAATAAADPSTAPAARRGRSGGATAHVAELLAGADQAYRDANPIGGGRWLPEPGDYAGKLVSFEVADATTRGDEPYLRFDLTIMMTEEGENEGKEVVASWNDIQIECNKRDGSGKEMIALGLGRLKAAAITLNGDDEEGIEGLDDAKAFIEGCCSDELPVTFRISKRKNSDWKDISIVEVTQ